MMTTPPAGQSQFTIKRTLNAPQELVWRAWTEEKEFAQWLRPFGVAADTVSCDVRVGGRYRYTMVNDQTGEQYPTGGEYLEVDPQDRLVLTWGDPDAPVDGQPVITLTLTAQGDNTLLNFHMAGHPGAPGDGFVYDGWDEGLNNLDQHLSSKKSV